MKYHFVAFLMLTFSVFAASCARSPEHFYFGSYSEAEMFYKKGEYERAIQMYQAYIDENPEGNMAVIAKYYIAKSRLELGQTEEAKLLFEEVVRNYPDVVWANFSQTQLDQMNES